jgi:hypothetical protein
MTSKELEINDIAGRIISLSALYSTSKKFVHECGITNYSLITDLKKGRVKSPGADVLAKIVRGTGCNGSWLLTGEGEMFDHGRRPQGENGMGVAMIKGVLNLVSEIEQHADALENIDLPKDVDIQLVRLVLKIMEQGRRSS